MSFQLVLLSGRPAVGKFTVGKLLAEQTGFPLLHNHAVVDLVAALFPFGSAPFVSLRERLWLDIADEAIQSELHGLVMTFAPERTVSDAFLPALLARVEAAGGALRVIELVCEPSELEQRLVQPSRRSFGKLRDLALYRELDERGTFTLPSMPAAELVVETCALDPAEVARRIAVHLR